MVLAGNGQWARARNTAGAKALVAEHEMDRQRRYEQALRRRQFAHRMKRAIRSLLHRERRS